MLATVEFAAESPAVHAERLEALETAALAVSRLFRDGAGEGGAGASKAAQIAEVDYLETGEAMAAARLVRPGGGAGKPRRVPGAVEF